ncbi:RIP metalloprotease RseP [Phenylobacterium sp.]|uniref:RIP metalloprotease RseP n=1 Tax=Phenylobacterium sp. TaxID=1871053 RepID=UPI002DE4B6EC|nr:RIP metalloprotease RseP [Phenylobacterium sp.]
MFGFLQSALLNFVPALLVLGLVVTVHEMGHFLAAKWLGTAVDRFSIGFGRAICSWRDKSGVEWRVGWLPLGGYVRFAGDENAASIPDAEELQTLRREIAAREGPQAVGRYFHFKPTWQRAIIVIAGPAANFVLAIALFAGLFMAFGHVTLRARVGAVNPGTVAAAAGLRAGDLIVRANGHPMPDFDELQQFVSLRAGVPITFTVQRGGQTLLIAATPRSQILQSPVAGPQHGGALGILSSNDPRDIIRTRYNPIEAVGAATHRTWNMVSTTVYFLGRMITGQVSTDSLRGPIGIAGVAAKVTELGAADATSFGGMVLGVSINLLQVAAMISVSLGFMNLLPLPVLDGGHLLFYAYEAVARRPLAAKVQAAGYRVGLALVLGLMLFATWNDLARLRVLNFLGGLFS